MLSRINSRLEKLWCAIGDFNEIVTQNEKLGGHLRPLRQMEAFHNTLEVNSLVDLGWVKQNYTWSNRHQNEIFTKERLDLAMANKEWVEGNGGSSVEILIAGKYELGEVECKKQRITKQK